VEAALLAVLLGVCTAEILHDTSGRPYPSSAHCAGDAFQSWLTRRIAAVDPAAVAEERSILQVLDTLGRKRLDRHVVARALAADAGGRYETDDLMAELDDLALTQVLAASPAFQKLASKPIRHRDPPPPAVPQVIAPAVPLESSNELLEALRETPRPAPPPRPKPKEVDVLQEAARFALVLRNDETKARAFLSVYARQPEAFRPFMELRRADPELEAQFSSAVERNLLADLEPRVLDLFRRMAAQLVAQGVAPESLEALAAQQPDTLRELLRSRWPYALRDADTGDWNFDLRGPLLVAKQDIGHFAFAVNLPVDDLLLHVVDSAAEPASSHTLPPPYVAARTLRRLRDCHRTLCLSGRDRSR
jgi:hypothetical protein